MALPPLEVRVTADTAQAEAGLKRVDSQLNKTASRTARYGRSAEVAAGSTANLAAQFNDIGVMLAAGQSPLLLAMQQGTQVNQVLGQMGTTGASRVKALTTAFMSVISPANLLTLGIIAGGAALVQWGISAVRAGEDAEELGATLEDATQKFRALNEENERLRLGDVTPEEKARLDEIERLQDLINAYTQDLERAGAVAQRRIKQTISGLEDQLRAERASLDNLKEARRENERLRAEQRNRTDYLLASAEMFRDAQSRIRKETGEAANRAWDLAEEIGRAGVEALELAGIDIASGVDEAAKAAARLAGQLNVSLERARELQSMSVAEAMGETMPGGLGGPTGPAGLLPQDPNAEFPSKGVIVNSGMFTGGGRSSGGGGGGATGDNGRGIALENFIESLQTEREVLEDWRVEQMDLLAQFNDEELAAIGGHNEARLRLEKEYQDRLSDIQQAGQNQYLDAIQTTLGNAAQILAQGGEKSVKIAKVFGVAEALISTWRGAAKALELPFPQNLAAFSTVLATGFNAVNSIKGVSAGGAGGSVGGAASGASAQPSIQTQRVDLNIIGGNDRDRLVAREVISVLNSAQRDGFRLDPRLIGV